MCVLQHVLLPGSDKLTAALGELMKARSFKKLDACEQLGLIVLAAYMRSAQLLGFKNVWH